MGRSYYMLVASLPHLPHFLKAERLPINPQKLRKRRTMLDPGDDADIERALNLLQWRRHPLTRTDREIDGQFREAMEKTRNSALRDFIDYLMAERSVMAGFRRKVKGDGPPSVGEPCGVGDWDRVIRSRWEREDFGLGNLFPWIPRARQLLAEGDPLELEKLLMDEAWRRLSRIAEARPFAFDALFAYAFKWDILARWLSRNSDQSALAFTTLVQEVIDEQQPQYA
jgi:hypothetical protein